MKISTWHKRAALALGLCLSVPVAAYELSTHAAMAQRAFERSMLNKTDRSLVKNLGLDFSQDLGSAYFDVSGNGPPAIRFADPFEYDKMPRVATKLNPDYLKINGWLMRGAIREDDGARVFGVRVAAPGEPLDDPYGNILRFCNHFLDPYHVSAFTGFCFGQTLDMSPNWAVGTNDAFAPSVSPANSYRNHFSVYAAREAMFRALTLKQQNADGSIANISIGGVLAPDASASDREKTQRTYWATTFRALGDVVHLIQDMAQPQHTRDEAHGTGHAAIYEKYIDARATQRDKFEIDALTLLPEKGQLPKIDYDGLDASNNPYPIPQFGSYTDYWSTARGSAPRNASLTTGQGLADYSSRGFLTIGTSIGLGGTDAARFPNPPRSVFNYGTPVVENTLCGTPVPYRSQYLVGTVSDTVAPARSQAIKLQSRSIFYDAALAITNNPAFTLNHCVFDEHAKLLIPRAVAYSTGILDYFFRGQLTISLPDEGVYAIADHSASTVNTIDTGGFSKVKLKIKNTTPAITPPGGTPTVQNMTGGKLVAVAKFHRNQCYKPELTGEYGSVGNTGTSCRGAFEEIVVSSETKVGGQPAQVISLPADPPGATPGDPLLVEFTFSPPIPINATDLFLQVVYRGPLGQESDAVAVATKDIAEPTFVGYYDNTEQYNYGSLSNLVSWKKIYCDDMNPPVPYDQCRYDHRYSIYLRFAAPVGYDPNQPVETFNATASILDLPISAYARTAILTDNAPYRTYFLLRFSQGNVSTSDFGPFDPAMNQKDAATGLLIPTIYQQARGIFADPRGIQNLSFGDEGAKPFPAMTPATPKAAQINF